MADKPPICPGRWLLGNATALLDDTAAVLTDGYETLGPMYRIRAAWRHYTVIAGPDAAEFMAAGLDKTHLSRERLFGPVAREFGADLVLKEIGPTHARLRAPLAVSYSRQVASPFVPAMVTALRASLRSRPAGTSLEVVDTVKSLAFEAYRVLLGAPPLAYRDGLLVTNYLMNVAARLAPPWVCRLPWYRRAHGRNLRVLTDLLHQRRADPKDGPPTLIDALVAVTDPSGARLTDAEVVSYSAYGIGASIGYVGRLTSFMLYEILRDPELHAALVAEARAAFAAGVDDASDLRRMRLLRSVYDETLRFHSVAIGMAFDVASSFEYLGKRIDQGDYLVLTPVPSSFSPTAFPDPHRFDPARCREPRNEHRQSGACQPFGLGDRTCSAMGLVELMSMTLVATLLHERAVTMTPATYVLSRTVRPLPSPNRKFRMRLDDHAVAAPDARSVIAPSPRLEEESLAAFPGHDVPPVREALAGAVRQAFAPGTVIIRQGDPADAFYLLEQGHVDVTRSVGGVTTTVATLAHGEWFGEAGLLQQAPRNATVTAGPDGAVTRVLGQQEFLAMVATSDLVASEIGQLLRRRAATTRLQHLAPQLTSATVAQLLPEFTPRAYRPGDAIVSEGEAASEFFVILAGEVAVTRRTASGGDDDVARLGQGDYFGELGLLHGAPRNATVSAAGERPVDVLVTGRAGFDRLLAESGGPRGELARAMLARVERLAD